jgi:hypothetical protein
MAMNGAPTACMHIVQYRAVGTGLCEEAKTSVCGRAEESKRQCGRPPARPPICLCPCPCAYRYASSPPPSDPSSDALWTIASPALFFAEWSSAFSMSFVPLPCHACARVQKCVCARARKCVVVCGGVRACVRERVCKCECERVGKAEGEVRVRVYVHPHELTHPHSTHTHPLTHSLTHACVHACMRTVPGEVVHVAEGVDGEDVDEGREHPEVLEERDQDVRLGGAEVAGEVAGAGGGAGGGG